MKATLLFIVVSSVLTAQNPTATCANITAVYGVAIVPAITTGSGGTAPYTFSAANLPAGLTMAANGRITGTASGTASPGLASYTVTIIDAVSARSTATCSITLALPPAACAYALTRTPVGPVLVYRNGLLQRQRGVPAGEPGDYDSVTPPGTYKPTITPMIWTDNDYMSAVITRAVPLTFTSGGQTVSYWGYSLWREDWNCVGDRAEATLALIELQAKRLIPTKAPKIVPWKATKPNAKFPQR